MVHLNHTASFHDGDSHPHRTPLLLTDHPWIDRASSEKQTLALPSRPWTHSARLPLYFAPDGSFQGRWGQLASPRPLTPDRSFQGQQRVLRKTIPSNAPTSSPPAPSHATAPAREASEPEKGPQEKLRRPSGTRVCIARPLTSASSGRVTRSQAGTSSARTPAAKNPIAAPRYPTPDGARNPHTSHSPSTDNSGAATASHTKVFELATLLAAAKEVN